MLLPLAGSTVPELSSHTTDNEMEEWIKGPSMAFACVPNASYHREEVLVIRVIQNLQHCAECKLSHGIPRLASQAPRHTVCCQGSLVTSAPPTRRFETGTPTCNDLRITVLKLPSLLSQFTVLTVPPNVCVLEIRAQFSARFNS